MIRFFKNKHKFFFNLSEIEAVPVPFLTQHVNYHYLDIYFLYNFLIEICYRKTYAKNNS
jgi:hypothetical protein